MLLVDAVGVLASKATTVALTRAPRSCQKVNDAHACDHTELAQV